jgi:hypothetical protein
VWYREGFESGVSVGEQLSGQWADERPLAAAVAVGGACCTRDRFMAGLQLQFKVEGEASRVVQGKSSSTV